MRFPKHEAELAARKKTLRSNSSTSAQPDNEQVTEGEQEGSGRETEEGDDVDEDENGVGDGDEGEGAGNGTDGQEGLGHECVEQAGREGDDELSDGEGAVAVQVAAGQGEDGGVEEFDGDEDFFGDDDRAWAEGVDWNIFDLQEGEFSSDRWTRTILHRCFLPAVEWRV